jgi:hypothetical protein
MVCGTCGCMVLADTEEWNVPRCDAHATDDGGCDKWRCAKCCNKPFKCACQYPEWTDKPVRRQYAI